MPNQNMNKLVHNWVSDPSVPGEANLTADHDSWHTLARDLQFDGEYAKVFLETVATPTRPEGITWTVVRRKSAVAIAARTEEGKWLMIHQERVAIRQALWEFPAGQLDHFACDLQVTLKETVWRELREETGYEAGAKTTLIPLGVFFPSAGFTDEHSHIFLADQVVPHVEGANPDEAESITECRAFNTAELYQMISTGEIRDANTLAAFARLVAMGLL